MDKENIPNHLTATTVKQILKERKKIYNGVLSKQTKIWHRKETIRGYLFSLPMIIWSSFFMLATVGFAFYLTTRSGFLHDLKPAGSENWKQLFKDKGLRDAIVISLKITGITAGFGIGMALVIATLLNTNKTYGKNIFMTLLFLPQVTSIIASTFVFVQILGPNGILKMDFNFSPEKVLWVVIFQNIWLQASSSIIIFNTAFTTIDRAQYEVASIDGASPIKKFLKLTIPSISNILIYTIFTSLVGGLAIFDAPFVIKGYFERINPSFVNTWASYGYRYLVNSGPTAEVVHNVGYGMVILITLAATIMLVTIIVNKIQPINKKRN